MSVTEEKQALRKQFRLRRSRITAEDKRQWDARITEQVKALPFYREAETVFTYISMPEEADTLVLIRLALQDGKTVAVPYYQPHCPPAFYRISSFDALKSGAMGILQPLPVAENQVTDVSNGICLVPGLGFDECGYRLGYGAGYYDRFLSEFGGTAVGLCYENCVLDTLPHDAWDCCVDWVVTEQGARKKKRG